MMIATSPRWIGTFRPKFDEYCFVQYMPVVMPGEGLRIPQSLMPFWDMVIESLAAGFYQPDDYVYLTVKKGWATTENPLNRPGWHIDAFGTPEDRNFVWTDRFPTRYVLGDLGQVPTDDKAALEAFDQFAGIRESDYVDLYGLYEFGQTVVHATPIIEEPGLRTFAKVSLSPYRYNLKGNAHNYLFDYQWEMFDRDELRNDPISGNKDYA